MISDFSFANGSKYQQGDAQTAFLIRYSQYSTVPHPKGYLSQISTEHIKI